MSSFSELNRKLSSTQLEAMDDLKEWVVKEAKFNGRKDEDFLLLFLRSCDFDVALTKKTLRLYYGNRVSCPQWWTNRDIEEPSVNKVLRSNLLVILINTNLQLPTVAFTRVVKFGSDSSVMNNVCKAFTIMTEVGCRRPSCQLNGLVIVTDTSDCPAWVVFNFLWPPFTKNVVNAFLSSLPVQITSYVFLNCSTLVLSAVKTFKFFLPKVLQQKVHCFGSDWSKLKDVVSLELIPAEYGGLAGPIRFHEEAFVEEVLLFNEYIVNDNQYGYGITKK